MKQPLHINPNVVSERLLLSWLVGQDVIVCVRGVLGVDWMVVEASVVVGYVIAWVIRKARHAAGHADGMVDQAIDAGLDRLHDHVVGKLGHDTALADLEAQARDDGQVRELTRQRVELAIADAADRDEVFARTVADLVAQAQAAEQAAGRAVGQVTIGPGAVAIARNADVRAQDGGVAAITMRDVSAGGSVAPPDPPQPERDGG